MDVVQVLAVLLVVGTGCAKPAAQPDAPGADAGPAIDGGVAAPGGFVPPTGPCMTVGTWCISVPVPIAGRDGFGVARR